MSEDVSKFPRARRPCTVLLVGKTPVIRDIIRVYLKISGHGVLFADDRESALEVARRLVPEVVLCPANSEGIRLCRDIKDDETTRTTRVVLLGTDPSVIRHADNLPYDGFLEEPVKPERLSAILAGFFVRPTDPES